MPSSIDNQSIQTKPYQTIYFIFIFEHFYSFFFFCCVNKNKTYLKQINRDSVRYLKSRNIIRRTSAYHFSTRKVLTFVLRNRVSFSANHSTWIYSHRLLPNRHSSRRRNLSLVKRRAISLARI